MRVVLLLTFALLAAGCVSPGAKLLPASTTLPGASMDVGLVGVVHDAAGHVLDLAAANMTRMTGGEYLIGAGSTEPSIGADAKGAVYMTGTSASGALGRNHPTVWATFDEGQTFKDVGPRLPTGDGAHPNTNDPILFVDHDTGRVFQDDIFPLSCGFLSYSDDQGKTWTTNPYSCGNSQVNDHNVLTTGKPRAHPTVGYPKVVYRCVNNVAYAACAMSFTGGLSFTPQIPVTPGFVNDCFGSLESFVKTGPDGKVYLPRAICGGGPIVFVSSDDGFTWSSFQIKTKHRSDGTNMGFAVDAANNLYATWWNKTTGVWYTASTDGGKTWFPERNVIAPGVTATMFATLAVGAPGKVAIAYVGSTVPGGYEGKGAGRAGLAGDLQGQPRLPEWDNATWNGYLAVMTDALDPNAPIQTVTGNDPVDPLARGLCGDTRCHGMNDFISIDIDPAGRPWASFVDTCTNACVSDPKTLSDRSIGAMLTLREGPALLEGGGVLPMLLPMPAK